MLSENKKAQMMIWAIVALVIFAGLIIFFFLKVKPSTNLPSTSDPKLFIQKCARSAALETIEKMLPQGGFVDPTNYKLWHSIKVDYLCQNLGSYFPCINQHPMLLSEENAEIKNNILPEIQNCFQTLKDESAKLGEKVILGEMNLSVAMAPRRVYISITRDTTIAKNEEASRVSNYDVEIESPLYDLSTVAQEIANQNARYCYFEYVGYQILYPEFKITVDTLSDSTRIYTIEDIESGKKMNIAIKGCAMPAGI
jgi:hypothetical protein